LSLRVVDRARWMDDLTLAGDDTERSQRDGLGAWMTVPAVLPVATPILSRGHRGQRLEALVEVRDVVESYLEADIGDESIRRGQQMACPVDAQAVDVGDEGHPGLPVESPREGARRISAERREFGFPQIETEIKGDVIQHVVERLGHVDCRLNAIADARQHAPTLIPQHQFEDSHEDGGAGKPVALEHGMHKRRHRRAGRGGEFQATLRLIDHLEEVEAGEQARAALDEPGAELEDDAALWDDHAGCHVTQPVMWQVGACHHQVSRSEAADIVADEDPPAGGRDKMDLELRMEMPAHRSEGVAVRPNPEGFAFINNDDLKFGLCHDRQPPRPWNGWKR
jgi:hypothetical protein